MIIKRIGHHINMLIRGYRKGQTSVNMPSNFDLDAMPSGMKHSAIRNATYRRVWYKRKNGKIIKKDIKYML